jgi:6-pyruvoyltetrahydropterin/6-carboxytetrahydropterin synthase
MFEVRIESSFAAAHFLTHYHGKCERLHGHNYRVRVYACGAALDEGGMLLDFSVLKKALGQVLESMDHSCLNDDPYFTGDPSAERIALKIYSALSALLPEPKLLSRVEVFETEKNMAAYEPD